MVRSLLIVLFILCLSGVSTAQSGSSMCAESCRFKGECTYDSDEDECVVRANADCRAAEICKLAGRCVASEDRCIANSEKDCLASTNCRDNDTCYLEGDACDEVRKEPAMYVAGYTVLGIGAGHVAAGVAFLAFRAALVAVFAGLPDPEPVEPVPPLLATVLGIGGGLVGIGLTLIVYGNEKERPDSVPAVVVGPGGASLAWEF